jgi:hypothetical protein
VLEKKIELLKKQYNNYKRGTIRNMLKLLEKEKCEKERKLEKVWERRTVEGFAKLVFILALSVTVFRSSPRQRVFT